MSKEKKPLSLKKLIKVIAQKTKISRKKAKKAVQVMLKNESSFIKPKNEKTVTRKSKEYKALKRKYKALSKQNKSNQTKHKSGEKKSTKNSSKDSGKKETKKSIDKTPATTSKTKKVELVKKAPLKATSPKVSNQNPSKTRVTRKSPPKQQTKTAAKKEVVTASRKPVVKADNLTKIEGIGPAISRLLKADGITTFKLLANTKVSRLQEVLDKAGNRFRIHSPATWPQQSVLAADGKWEELKLLQGKLKGNG